MINIFRKLKEFLLDTPLEKPKSHLQEYLEYYEARKNPGYAVLVTGAWGTGKTFQVCEALPNAAYVSLHGLNSQEAISNAVFAALHPQLSDAKGTLEAIEKATPLKKMGISLSGLMKFYIEPNTLMIFDDLERCALSTSETLGVINSYIEQYDCRVIVIAHDGKITFEKTKEKYFGQSIEIVPETSAAFDVFTKAIGERKTRGFIRSHKNNIMMIFEESGIKSLRILRHVVEDLARVHALLNPKHASSADAMEEMVQLFCALDIEVRSEKINEDDLTNRSTTNRFIRKNVTDRETNFDITNDKYPLLELGSTVLQDDLLIQMLIKGSYKAEQLHKSLDASSYFIDPKVDPPWKIVSNYFEQDDAILNKAITKMNQQFKARSVENSGEMLHIFALRLMMSEEGIIPHDQTTVVTECEAYIDELLSAGTLPQRELEWDWKDKWAMSYGGVVYWNWDNSPPLKKIYDYLIDAREKALDNNLPNLANELLDLLNTDSHQFYQNLCVTNQEDNIYSHIPILAKISPKSFADAILAAPKDNWRNIYYVFKNRYDAKILNNELKEEKSWVKLVILELDNAANSEQAFAKLRIERLIPVELRSLV